MRCESLIPSNLILMQRSSLLFLRLRTVDYLGQRRFVFAGHMCLCVCVYQTFSLSGNGNLLFPL